MFIQTEQTPNPSTLKFLPGRVVMEKGEMLQRATSINGIARFPRRLGWKYQSWIAAADLRSVETRTVTCARLTRRDRRDGRGPAADVTPLTTL